ncbi:hypothetical protein M885DRAFT_505544 [Pelagophyceae sp. CCMP2097]|nr:hypothetical protein M885DRAFT_505544 [Pelagophyceae sp. CCMP2097]|mmetsp:Transcript_16154/g.56466  ORF Transcript_16154/g.56466 Transcript_16154/m.56466 type:complete len:216 (+) Transcript_16154:12-659(+)
MVMRSYLAAALAACVGRALTLGAGAPRRPAGAKAQVDRRQALATAFLGAASFAASAPASAAGIFGTDPNLIGIRLPEYAVKDEGVVVALEDAALREAMVRCATGFYVIGDAVRLRDGDGAEAVQRFYVREWKPMRAAIDAAGAGVTSKPLRKNTLGFVTAAELVRESFNVGSFDLATKQYDYALLLLGPLLTKLGVDGDVATAVAAQRALVPAAV